MADARFCVGFSSACRQAREGGGLPGCEPGLTAEHCIVPRRGWLPPEIVRLIDALVRRLEHEDMLLRMNGGVLGVTLCEASAAGGLRDVHFLLARGPDLEATTAYVSEEGRGHAYQRTPLVWAADAGHLAVCISLLNAGARPGSPTASGLARVAPSSPSQPPWSGAMKSNGSTRRRGCQ